MKKVVFILFIVFGLTKVIVGQRVDSIVVEQAGDFIKIRYKILNSNNNQLFRVNILFSVGGGLKTELSSVTGDVGDQVLGGKNEYWVVWDVLKDITELKDAEFFVRAELVKQQPEILTGKKARYFYSLFCMEVDQQQRNIGFRFAYMKSFGVSASIVGGPKPFDNNANANGKFIAFSTSVDLTKRLLRIDNFEGHILAGLAAHRCEPYNTTKVTKTFFAPDVGMILAANRLSITISMSGVKKDLDNSNGKFYTFGLGLRF